MPKWHPRSFHVLEVENLVEFFKHGEDPNDDPSLTPRWEGPVEVKVASEDDGQTVRVGTEHFEIDSDDYQAWVRAGGYSPKEVRLRGY